MIIIKPFDGAKITQTFLDATRVIKSFRICKDSLTSFLAGLKMSPVDSLLLKVGKNSFHSRHCLPVYLLWKSFGGYHTPAVAWSLIQMYTDSRGHCGECTQPANSNAF